MKYEYLAITLRWVKDDQWGGAVSPPEHRLEQIVPTGSSEEAWVQVLNHYGSAGWEFCAMSGDTAICKRPVSIQISPPHFNISETFHKDNAEFHESIRRYMTNALDATLRKPE